MVIWPSSDNLKKVLFKVNPYFHFLIIQIVLILQREIRHILPYFSLNYPTTSGRSAIYKMKRILAIFHFMSTVTPPRQEVVNQTTRNRVAFTKAGRNNCECSFLIIHRKTPQSPQLWLSCWVFKAWGLAFRHAVNYRKSRRNYKLLM